LERQLRLRRRLLRTQQLDHEQLFVTDTVEPIRRLQYPYARWRRTLGRLSIRYRKPYAARHSSVSWDLMIGRNLLWVARQRSTARPSRRPR
jgi:integrase